MSQGFEDLSLWRVPILPCKNCRLRGGFKPVANARWVAGRRRGPCGQRVLHDPGLLLVSGTFSLGFAEF